MTPFMPFSRDQAFLLPPDAKDWLLADDVAPVVVAAVDHMPCESFAVRAIPCGRAQDHPRLLALLIQACAEGPAPTASSPRSGPSRRRSAPAVGAVALGRRAETTCETGRDGVRT